MLHVSLKCQYAIKALVRLATAQADEPVQAREIAQFGGIPAKFLEQVMHDLRTAGLVRSLRGKNGGYTLTRDPAQITFAAVIDVIEGSHGGAGRMAGDDQAQRLVEPVWRDVRHAVRGVLQSATIADAAARGAAAPMYFI
jgi:Rrf2 family protein